MSEIVGRNAYDLWSQHEHVYDSEHGIAQTLHVTVLACACGQVEVFYTREEADANVPSIE
jgi:hypothetical protein